MGQRGYTVAFLLVLLAACAGAFFGVRFLFGRLSGPAQQTTWTPPQATADEQVALATDPAQVQAQTTTVPGQVLTAAAPAEASRTPMAPRLILTPFVPPTPTFEPSSTPEPPLPTPAVTATATLTPTAVSLFPFVLAGLVRNLASSNECNGASNLILGRVLDRSGNPMPDIRLHLVDEFNAVNDIKATKSGANEAGMYNFPVFDPGRRYYLTIVDVNGTPLSDRVEIEHHVGANAKATCHWADWEQQ
jgi:hypothetical protein